MEKFLHQLIKWMAFFLNYDKNGDLLTNNTSSYITGASSNNKTYSYDMWGRMTDFTDSLGETASYTYYSDGLRASKTVGTDLTKYYYNGDNVINETLNGNNYATNVLGVNGYISRQQNGTIGYLFKNAHGDVISAYSSTTNKLADYTYDAWGKQKTETETTSFTNNPLRYAGQYYDYESGMTYLRARYYDSSIRRFISEDPIRDGLNWYAYANNNPVMFVDPSGLESYIFYLPEWEDDAISDKEDLINMGISEEEIILVPVKSRDDLVDGWNGMGTIKDNEGNNTEVPIEHVIINVHGAPNAIMSSYAKGDGWTLTSRVQIGTCLFLHILVD